MKSIEDQIEEKAMKLFKEMAHPTVARLGTKAFKEFNNFVIPKEKLKSDTKPYALTKLHVTDGTITIVEDSDLTPDEIIVE